MLNTTQIALTLRAHAVRLTPCRHEVLGVLWQTNNALSRSELAQQIGHELDRVTLFRTLRLLEQKGLIHRVADYTETVRYAISTDLRSPVQASAAQPAAHVHFKCTSCQRLYCLPPAVIPSLPQLGHHQVLRCDYLLSGVCERCLAQTSSHND